MKDQLAVRVPLVDKLGCSKLFFMTVAVKSVLMCHSIKHTDASAHYGTLMGNVRLPMTV